MTLDETAQCMAMLAIAYPRFDVSQDAIKLWATMLGDIEFATAQAGVQRHIATSQWPPTIAELRAECAASTAGDLPSAEAAWGEVTRAIGRWGMNRHPTWSCDAVEHAVNCIGWRQICLDENVMSTRRVFIDAYKAFCDGRQREAQLGRHALPSARRNEKPITAGEALHKFLHAAGGEND